MNLKDISPIRIDRPDSTDVLELLLLLLALIGFVRVASFTLKHARNGTLVATRHAPPIFPVGPLTGTLFSISVILLVFAQSPFFYLLVAVGLWVFLSAEGLTAERQFGLNRVGAINLVKWSLVVCGAFLFVEIPLSHVVDRIMTAVQLPHPEQEAVEIFRHFSKLDDIARFMLQAVVLSPLIEELFFRGFLFTFLKRFTTVWVAIVFSAGVFAFAHANLGSVLQLWLLGTVLAVAYENTGSLLLPIGIHSCFNLITALSLLMEKGGS